MTNLDYQVKAKGGPACVSTQNLLQGVADMMAKLQLTPNSRIANYIGVPNTERFKVHKSNFIISSIEGGMERDADMPITDNRDVEAMIKFLEGMANTEMDMSRAMMSSGVGPQTLFVGSFSEGVMAGSFVLRGQAKLLRLELDWRLERGVGGAARGIGKVGKLSCVPGCGCLHSFTPETPVLTSSGLLPISSLLATDGTGNAQASSVTQVWTYNETTGKNELKTVNHVFKNNDPELTFLTLEGSKKGSSELITTTPEHPFYVSSIVENPKTVGPQQASRPKPLGHADLNVHWVGAGHLEIGDKIRTADGSSGTVLSVLNVVQARVMYNLEVAGNHDFFVGNDGWLVHNCNLGDIRVARVAQDYKVLYSEMPTNVKGSGIVKGGIDLILKDGDLIRLAEVGGGAKTQNKLGSQFAKLQQYAEKFGGTPTFFYDTNTPKEIVDFAMKKLGASNVLPIPAQRW